MYLPDIELHEPDSLAQAAELLARHAPHARALAGGTDLLVDLKTGRSQVAHVVSLNRLADLRGVREQPSHLRIGALTTPGELLRAPVIRTRFPAFRDALADMAAPQVRNMATVGGNIASAVPSADLPPILICYRAAVVLHAQTGERSVPLAEFFLGPRRTVMQPGEILTAIHVPFPPRRFGAAYARFALRAANACAVAGVAAAVELEPNGVVRTACLVLGAVAPRPQPVESAAAALAGRVPTPDDIDQAARAAMKAAEPISDLRGSAEYRREVVGVLARRALTDALRRASESSAAGDSAHRGASS